MVMDWERTLVLSRRSVVYIDIYVYISTHIYISIYTQREEREKVTVTVTTLQNISFQSQVNKLRTSLKISEAQIVTNQERPKALID